MRLRIKLAVAGAFLLFSSAAGITYVIYSTAGVNAAIFAASIMSFIVGSALFGASQSTED